MPTVLAAVGTSVSLFAATITLIQKLVKLYGDVKNLPQELCYLELDLRGCKASMDNWMGLWAMKGHSKLSDSAYKYFWGRDAYEEVQHYLECLLNDLERIEARLTASIQNKRYADSLPGYRRVGFVVFDQDDMRDRFNRLRQALENLDKITRSKFWATVDGTAKDAKVDNSLVIKLATLKEQSERLWITLDHIHKKMPSSRMAASTEIVPPSSWHLFKGTGSCSSIDLGFLRTRGDEAILSQFRYEPGQDASEMPRRHIKEATDRIIQQAETPVSVVSGSSLQEYFGRISKHPSDVQAKLRGRSRLDRAAVAHEIAQWAVLNWNSAWVDELCICKIYHFFTEDDSAFGSPFRSVEPKDGSRRSERHSCMNEASAERRHLRLALVVASLALACQVIVVANTPGRSFCFVASIEGSMQQMNERELVDLIREDKRNYYWHRAVYGCLKISHRGDSSEQMLPVDFERYEELVLEPSV